MAARMRIRIILMLTLCTGFCCINDLHPPIVLASAQGVQDREQSIRDIQKHRGNIEVILQKNFVCGEEFQSLGVLAPEKVAAMALHHPHWHVEFHESKGQAIFIESIEHFSPHCSQSVYFGIDHQGKLALYEGLPNRNHLIRTYFQLNLQSLTKRLPYGSFEQLKRGIKVTDIGEYHSVLSTLSEYEVNSSRS